MISALALPLLGKELRERANQPRTYMIRVIAAMLFFGTFLWFCGSSLQAAEAGGIGGGSAVLLPVLTLQLVGIHLFIPALMCGSIAAERESGTLDLLRLTRLGPWQIVMEKFFAGLLPVLTFVLLGVPLYAVAYALGGVEPEEVLYIARVLVLALAEVGAFTLLMSACCTTPISAFVATYALGGILCWSAPELADLVGDAVPGDAPWILTHHQFQLFVPAGLWIDTDRPGMPQWAAFAIWTVPSTVATFLALGAARFVLIRSPWTLRRVKNCLAKLALTRRLASAGWVTLGWQPIFWRHCRGTVLAKPSRIAGIGVALGFGAIASWFIFPVTVYSSTFGGNLNQFDAVTVICSAAAGMFILVRATSVVAAERAQQTLNVLLTTPMTASRIVREKAAVIWRGIALGIPLLATLLLLAAVSDTLMLWTVAGITDFDLSAAINIGASLFTIVCYPFALLWICIWIGLRIRKRRTALLTALSVIAVLAFLPLFIGATPDPLLGSSARWREASTWLRVFSPGHFQVSRQNGRVPVDWGFQGIPFLVLHFAWISALGLWLRHLSLRNSDRYLRRAMV